VRLIPRFALLLLLTTAPTAVVAQVAPEGALRPDAERLLPRPDYAVPPAPPPALPTKPSAPQAMTGGASVTLTAILVEGDRAQEPVLAWEPQIDPASGLKVTLEPDELLGPEWVQRQFADNGLVGRPVPYARIVGFIQLINARFAKEGFINSGLLVPPQEPVIESGPLTLRLVLGRVPAEGFVVADPPGGLSVKFVQERMPSAYRSPFNAAAFERDFRLLAEDPAVATVNADLRPTGRAGEAALAVSVTPADRFDLYATIANSRTPAIGPERFAIGASVRNILTAGDLLAAEVGITEGVTDFAGTYSLPVFDPRTRFYATVGLNDALVIDAVLAPLDIRTESVLIGAGLAHDLVKTPLMPQPGGGFTAARTLSAKAQFDFRNTKTFLLGEPFSFAPGSVRGLSRYYAARAGLDYVSRSVSEVLASALTVTIGVDGTRSDIPGVPAPDKHFVGVLGQATYARRLNEAGTEIRARATAQWHSSVAYAGERLPIGGANSVRGYRETLYLVDNGATGSIELSQPFNLSRRSSAPQNFNPGAFAVSAFIDAAWLENIDVPDPPRDFIAGAGLALAWVPSPGFTARITWAHNFQDVRVPGPRDLQDRGVQFSVTLRPVALFRRN
jgi:hemolysin activation/secretion protein